MDNEWNEESDVLGERRLVKTPHLLIRININHGIGDIMLTKNAYERLGEPEYVRVAYSKANGMYRIQLIPCNKEHGLARRLRVSTNKGAYRMGGAPGLIKRYGMPKGYYIMDENKVFTWRHA